MPTRAELPRATVAPAAANKPCFRRQYWQEITQPFQLLPVAGDKCGPKAARHRCVDGIGAPQTRLSAQLRCLSRQIIIQRYPYLTR